jgi:hypothetical protein
LADAGIELGEFKDQVFERSSQIIADFSHANPKANRNGHIDLDAVTVDVLPTFGLELGDNKIIVFPLDGGVHIPQITKAFICPIDPLKRAIEGMRRHGIILTK